MTLLLPWLLSELSICLLALDAHYLHTLTSALVYIRNLLRAIGAYDPDLVRVIKRDLRDRGVIYSEITTEEMAEHHIPTLDISVRETLGNMRQKRRI
jgi:hypothetical protein